MEGITMEMGSLQAGASAGALKGSLATQKNAVATLMTGAEKVNIPQKGDEDRAAMMQAQGVGQKLDVTA